jgi:uncharacterized protein (TIGR02996 family)
MSPIVAHLASARALLLKGGRDPDALAVLLEAWRAHPHPDIARAIDLVSYRIEEAQDPIADSPAAWAAVESSRHPEDFGRLAARIATRKDWESRTRLHKLLEWPEDPRLNALIVRLLREVACTVEDSWRTLFQRLEGVSDPTVLEPLRRLPEHWKQILHDDHYRLWLPEQLGARLPALEQRLGAGPAELTPEERAACAALAPLLDPIAKAAKQGGELLDAIFDNPEDDGARLVYADWLLERGDPRGEFIHIQYKRRDHGLSPAEEKHERALLKKHVHTWLGPDLTRAVAPKQGLRFERGFPVTIQIVQSHPNLLGCRAFTTVEEIDISGGCKHFAIFVHPVLARLRALRNVGAQDLTRLMTSRQPLGIEILEGDSWLLNDATFARMREVMPRLREIETVGEPHDVAAIVKSRLGQQLTRATVHYKDFKCDIVLARAPGVPLWTLRASSEPDPHGRPDADAQFVRGVVDVLRALGPVMNRIEIMPHARLSGALCRRLVEAAGTHTRLDPFLVEPPEPQRS